MKENGNIRTYLVFVKHVSNGRTDKYVIESTLPPTASYWYRNLQEEIIKVAEITPEFKSVLSAIGYI